MTDIDNFENILDVRDIIARVEELRVARDEYNEKMVNGNAQSPLEAAAFDELETLESLLSDLAGCGGDEQWQGEWYPVTLIRDSYFTEYIRKSVSNIGDLPRDMVSYIDIDWEATAGKIQMDYSSVEFGDVTYWYR